MSAKFSEVISLSKYSDRVSVALSKSRWLSYEYKIVENTQKKNTYFTIIHIKILASKRTDWLFFFK